MHKRPLLLVLLLAALLPWILHWIMQAYRSRQLDRCRSNTLAISSALEMYASDFGGRYPPSLATLTKTGHLKAIPTCPTAGLDNYSASYHATAVPDRFSVGCAGRHHGEPSREKTYPAWWDRRHCAPQGFPWCDSEVCTGCMGVYVEGDT